MKTGSVIKRVALLLMVAALAVAMVACQGAVGPKGDKGDKGDSGPPGTTGPKGDPGDAGTSDNSPPMASALPDVYIALGGTGVTPMKMKSVDLNKYFTDAESAQIDFKAMSSDPTVASVGTGVLAMGMLQVTGKKAGTATITVHAYDNVNDPVAETIKVTVVSLNSAPTGSIPTAATNKLGAILYKKNGPVTRSIEAATNAGPAGSTLTDSVKASVKYWPAATLVAARLTTNEIKAEDAKVSVSIMPGTKAGTWDVTMTPNKEGKELVVVYFEDLFGAQVMAGEFTAHVNTVPKLAGGNPMKDVTIYHDAGTTSKPTTHTFTVADHFDGLGALDAPPTAAALEADTSSPYTVDARCSVTTTQPKTIAGHSVAASNVAATTTAADIALVTANYVSTASAVTVVIDAGTAADPAAAVGQFDVTITCEDEELSIYDSATITVRP